MTTLLGMPIETESLETVPEALRVCYEAHGAGYRMTEFSRQRAAEHQAEQERLATAEEEKIADERRKLDAWRKSGDRMSIDAALRDALVAGDCDRTLLRAAAGVLQASWKFEVADGAVRVANEYGSHALAPTVRTWLRGEGSGFLGEPHGEAVDTFASAIRRLSDVVH